MPAQRGLFGGWMPVRLPDGSVEMRQAPLMLKEPYRSELTARAVMPSTGASLLMDPRKRPSQPLPIVARPRWSFEKDSWDNRASRLDPPQQAARAAGWASDMVGNKDYQQDDPNRNVGGRRGFLLGGRGAPKCNIFVGDALQYAGIDVRDSSNRKVYQRTTAWGNPESNIPGFQVVKGSLEPGDVISDGHHVGIYMPNEKGEPNVVSAADRQHRDQVVQNRWGLSPQEKATAWRYVGNQSKPAQAR